MSTKYCSSPYTIYAIILYSPSSKYCLRFCVSYIFNKRVMLLWVWWDATEKYKWKNVWKWGIGSSIQPGCLWLLTVQGILSYIYIVWSIPNIQKKFTSHAIIFQNNNTADTKELELMSMSGFLTCFYLLTFLTRRIKLRWNYAI